DESSPLTLFALLGVLGSRVMGRIAFEQFLNLQRQVFPKVSVRMVRNLPLPDRDGLITPEAMGLVGDLDALVRRMVAGGPDPGREQRLEFLVGRLYGQGEKR